ncbi:MAG: hypothetical protein ABIR30_06545 [Chitinophagaceae bacterium]
MKKGLLYIGLLILSHNSFSQKIDLKDTLYKLEKEIISGDTSSLRKICSYINDTTSVVEFLGYHRYPNTASEIAIRIIKDNCLLTADQFKFDSSVTTTKFLQLLNNGKLVFDDLSGTFLITQISDRKTPYQIRNISANEVARIDTAIGRESFPEWYYYNQIDGFIATKNPEALKWIASAWFQKRDRFNWYYFNNSEFLDLIKKLTRVDVGVPEKGDEISFLYNDGYYRTARLNFLIYWATHYEDYKWNDKLGYFENKKETGAEKSENEVLFELLSSDNDSTAIDAFKKITELDPQVITLLIKDYEENDLDANYSLPNFLYPFIRQLSLFTQYCRRSNIAYKDNGWLNDSLDKLKLDLDYITRYRLEDHIVKNLKVEDAGVVEYFGLIFVEEWNSTFSIGRILDKFYSIHFNELCAKRKHLLFFLKKSNLFDNLGIIGNCNKYLFKFKNTSAETITALKSIINTSNDPKIVCQAKKAISYANTNLIPENKWTVKSWEGNKAAIGVTDLDKKYIEIKKSKITDQEKKRNVQDLLGDINYEQIGDALKLLQKDTLFENYDKYHFLESDYGFYIDIYSDSAIEFFLDKFKNLTQYKLYEYYLAASGLNCLDSKGNFDYNTIFNVLKYDIVDAFAGGGGGRRDNGVYLIIKLLELKHKTTLGFPDKKCNWKGMYSCDSDLMAKAKSWMLFLEQQKLVNVNKADPPSISYNE